MLDSQVFHCYEAYEPASSSLAKPYSAIWPEMPSPATVAEFHIKTVIERHHLYQIHEKRKSSMELCCCFFHIQMSSLLPKMQPDMNGPLPVSGQNFCSPALNLAAGVGDVEYLTNCIMLHNRLENELAEITNFGPRGQQTKMLWN